MKHAIAITLYNRPQETFLALHSIGQVPEFRDLEIIVSIDQSGPIMERALEEIAYITLPDATVLVQPNNLGCNANTRFAINHAFSNGADFVTYIEDDCMVAKSAGAYLKWARERFYEDKSVFSVSLWRHPFGWTPSCGRSQMYREIELADRRRFFTSWGFSTWRDRWEEILPEFPTVEFDHSKAWDTCVNEVRKRTDPAREEILPLIARCQNIGERFGVHRGACINEHWAGSFQGGRYNLVGEVHPDVQGVAHD